VQVRPLSVSDAWEFTPRVFGDSRGAFLEWFRAEVVSDTIGHPLTVTQANHSISARGVVRGIHYASVPPSQAKYVYCPKGAVLDVVIDIRVGSPTYGTWDAVRLDEVDRRAVYVSEGLGHAFMSLQDESVVTYLCSTGYNPSREFGVHPLDPALELPWPNDLTPVLSDKDGVAPTLDQARIQGLLPTYAECQAFYSAQKSG
jgi:dTDP-4-dehydrorhamnose 3,5-epimerase